MLSTLLTVCGLVASGMAACPDIPSLEVFDVPQYAGQWYEIQRYPLISELGSTCAQAMYVAQPDGSVRLENRGRRSDGSLDSITGSAYAEDPEHPAALTLLFDEGFQGSYNVIRTDYNASALVYSCTNLFGARIEYAWFLSREPTMDQAVQDEYTRILADAGSDTSQLSVTPQDCGSLF
ncbi:apolipoprotein D-like [Amphibalanus amphitrite]|uniref:apolipoprotein D-like n=1 Tax=Amphibalanus amphitrite TaxID=1232801 RepID=UPI001C91FD86|nr:apolipoprotein D-like [Amphibalanus amphitrite]